MISSLSAQLPYKARCSPHLVSLLIINSFGDNPFMWR
jgi:hypothetical protein